MYFRDSPGHGVELLLVGYDPVAVPELDHVHVGVAGDAEGEGDDHGLGTGRQPEEGNPAQLAHHAVAIHRPLHVSQHRAVLQMMITDLIDFHVQKDGLIS